MKTMRFLLITVLFLALRTSIFSQTCIGIDPSSNNLSLCQNIGIFNHSDTTLICPDNPDVGVDITRRTIGIYGHFRTGDIKIDDFSAYENILGIGLSYNQAGYGVLLLGISYNELFGIKNNCTYIDISDFHTYSMEIGVMAKVPYTERVYIFVMTDWFNQSFEAGLGIKLS